MTTLQGWDPYKNLEKRYLPKKFNFVICDVCEFKVNEGFGHRIAKVDICSACWETEPDESKEELVETAKKKRKVFNH